MNAIDISGKWAGYYTYDDGYDEEWSGVSEAFTMELAVENNIR